MGRLFVRFSSPLQKLDSLQRIAVDDPAMAAPGFLYSQPDVALAFATDEARRIFEESGAEIFEDVQFRVLPSAYDDDDDYGGDSPTDRWAQMDRTDPADRFSLKDVVAQVNAPMAWAMSRGKGATIAIVDTGVADGLNAISPTRRSPIDIASEFEGRHWTDAVGHGSMCAAIAAGSRADGGRYDGIAPEATVLSARTDLTATDISILYDELLRAQGEKRLTAR